MLRLVFLISFTLLFSACEYLQPPEDSGPRIRTQSDVDAYNATVGSESEKLVCTRETVVGSNFRQFVCMTVAQRDRLASAAQQSIEEQRRGF